MKNKKFTRFPNKYIQGNFTKKHGLSRIFYITYILIDKYRTCEDNSWITIKKIFEFNNHKISEHKPKAFYEIIDVLKFMVNNNMIKINTNLDKVNYETGIEIEIIPENFDCERKFSIINTDQLNYIASHNDVNKDGLLLVFLYMLSYMSAKKTPDTPCAFFKSIDSISKEFGMSRNTITQYIQCLTTGENPLFIKYNTGLHYDNDKKGSAHTPNIYVLNKDGYKKEIELAKKYLLS